MYVLILYCVIGVLQRIYELLWVQVIVALYINELNWCICELVNKISLHLLVLNSISHLLPHCPRAFRSRKGTKEKLAR